MNNVQILKAAIEKAESNGYILPREKVSAERVVFSHEFAKAFFGERIVCGCCGKLWEEHGCYYGGGHPLSKPEPEYIHHLSIMVRDEDPIQYLKQFIDD